VTFDWTTGPQCGDIPVLLGIIAILALLTITFWYQNMALRRANEQLRNRPR